MSHTFQPGSIEDEELRSLFTRLQRALNDAQPDFTYQARAAAPARTVGSMVVVADGTNWNPGAGAGMYLRNEANTQWNGMTGNDQFDPGTVTVPTECFRLFAQRLTLSSTNSLTVQGTGRIQVI